MLKVKVYVCVLVLIFAGICFAGVINVPGDFPTIQEAIDAASSGDMVLVVPGTYHEHITLKVGITLQSAEGPYVTIIDGGGSGSVVTATDSSTINGFTITGSWGWDMQGGIFADKTSPAIINNIITGNECGILLKWNPTPTPSPTPGPTPTPVPDPTPPPPPPQPNTPSKPIIINNIITGNRVGIDNSNTFPTITNNTISDNWYLGIFNSTAGSSVIPIITNNIISGAEYGIFNSHSFPIITYNDIWDNDIDIYNEFSSLPTLANNIFDDPLFVDAVNNDYTLQVASPCIDAGDNSAPYLLEYDIDGKLRVLDGNCDDIAATDMGAFEFDNPCIISPQEMAEEINEEIQGLPDEAFDRNPTQRKNAMSNKIEALIAMIDDAEALIDAGLYEEAIDKLQNDIRPKMDGSLGGNPRNDWFTDPDAQAELCAMVDGLIAYLEDVIAGIARTLADHPILKPSEIFLNVYPNPFNASIRIEAPDNAVVSVYNIKGQEVDRFTGGTKLWIPDNSLTVGVYLIRASLDNTTLMRRVIYLK